MKTVVACPLEGPSLNAIKHWLKSYQVTQGPIDFVHIVRRVVYPSDMMTVQETPTPEQFKVYKETFAEHLRTQLFSLLPQELRGSSTVSILLSAFEEEEMIEHLKHQKAHLCVVGTRDLKGFQGLFTSSFAAKMMKSAPCDVLILRPRN
ncbi:MAG: universal stress protein [Bacteriovoracaceae bacterium]|nr:universal stress protein [Bacteriovoracaceae bacterium]